jgi:hypothetical protein
VIDGKLINIVKPMNSGSYCCNYKGKFNIVQFANVNANFEFIMVQVGTNGKVSDGSVLQERKFYDKHTEGSLQLPSLETPDGSLHSLRFSFVGDKAFPLLENQLNPYPQKGLPKEE